MEGLKKWSNKEQRKLVPRNRFWNGRNPKYGIRNECVHTHWPRYLVKFSNKGELIALVEGDNKLYNPYGIIVVNPAQHPHIKRVDAEIFANWLVSKSGQTAIATYKIKGQQAFFPNAQGFKK